MAGQVKSQPDPATRGRGFLAVSSVQAEEAAVPTGVAAGVCSYLDQGYINQYAYDAYRAALNNIILPSRSHTAEGSG